MLLESGVGLLTVSRMLGHSSIGVTGDPYGPVSRRVAAEAVETMERAMTG